MLSALGSVLRTLGQRAYVPPVSPPATPEISGLVALGAASLRVAISGAAGATHRLYHRASEIVAWTAGESRVGDGQITQAGLAAGWRQLIVVSLLDGAYSLPSRARSIYLAAAGDAYVATAVRAAWAALRANSALDGYMSDRHGSYYDEAASSKKPLQITKSDCPALIMAPGLDAITVTPATNVCFDVAVPLNFDLRSDLEAVDDTLNFLDLVLKSLHAAWVANSFALDQGVGLYDVSPGSAQINKLYEDQDKRLVFVCWQAAFPYTLRFRRQLEL